MRVAMRVCGGGGAPGHYSGRGLLVGAPQPQPQPPDPSLIDAQRLQLELVLTAIAIVVFVASVSYVALSTILSCLCTGAPRRQQPGGGEMGPRAQRPAATVVEETKRALEEIPVVVVQVTTDPAGSDEPGECAVCLAEYASGEELRVLPACGHGFHRECVDRWLLTRAPTCPICRVPVAAHAEGTDAKV